MTDNSPYEPPYRILRHLASAVIQAIQEQITEHEVRAHIPLARRGRPQSVPFCAHRIPDSELAAVQEVIETEDLTDEEACERFGYPPSLLARELARYRVRFRRWVQSGAGA